jgi:hypothetical protein
LSCLPGITAFGCSKNRDVTPADWISIESSEFILEAFAPALQCSPNPSGVTMSVPPKDEQVVEPGPAADLSSPAASARRPPTGSEPKRVPLAPALLTAFCLALILPNVPYQAFDTDLDSSWHGVLTFAHNHGWQCGRDIVFPFGPLGFLFTPAFTGYSLGLRLLVDVILSFIIATGICMLAWRNHPGWRLLLLLLVAAIFTALDTLFELGVVCWGLLCLIESGWRAKICHWALAGLVAVVALWKCSLAMAGGATLLTVAAWQVLQGQRRAASWLLGGGAALFLVGWMFLGQKLSSLWPYSRHSLDLCNGYNLTMSTPAPREFRMAGVAAAALTLLAIALRTLTFSGRHASLLGRALLPCWLAFVTFLAWKHGFVRSHGHEAFFFGFAAMLTLALEALPSTAPWSRRTAQGAALLVVLLACAVMDWRMPGAVGQRLNNLFPHFSRNLRTMVSSAPYQSSMDQALAAQRRRSLLPRLRERVGGATVDVFGQNQAFALYNDLNYQPRPVFQSYCAYTRGLMNLNERFYEGTAAPDFVLFNLSPLDYRLPAIEDSGALRTLLSRYQLIDAEGLFLLFERTRDQGSQLVLIRQGTASVGEAIPLTDSGDDDLWMEITLRPTWAGSVKQFLYQPPMVYLCNWTNSPPQRGPEFRAPAPMLAAGFIVRPLLTETLEVADLFAGNANLRPSAVSVETSARDRTFYRQPFSFRIYRIEPRLVTRPDPSLARLRWPGFRSFPLEVVSWPTPMCLTIIDGKSVIRLPPWGQMKFTLPPGATQISGAYGFEESAYTVGTTDGAEFRIELRGQDGSANVIHSLLLEPKTKPQDRGLHTFTVPIPSGAQGTLVLRALPGPRNDTAWDLTCWADIEIK